MVTDAVLIKEVRTEMPSLSGLLLYTHLNIPKYIWPILKCAVQIHLRAIVQNFTAPWRRRMQEMFHLCGICSIGLCDQSVYVSE